MIKDLEWINIENRFAYFICVLMFKCLYNIAPNCLADNFQYVSNTQPYNTRNASDNKLVIPRCHKSLYARSLYVCGPQYWNNLNSNVRNSTTLAIFKSNLKSFM
jgi:hypothetical protein